MTNWIRLWPKNHFNAVCLRLQSIQLENRIQIKSIISFPSPIAPLRNEFVAAVLPASRLFIFQPVSSVFSLFPLSFFLCFGRWAQHFVHFLWLLHIYAIKIANMPQRRHTTPVPSPHWCPVCFMLPQGLKSCSKRGVCAIFIFSLFRKYCI